MTMAKMLSGDGMAGWDAASIDHQIVGAAIKYSIGIMSAMALAISASIVSNVLSHLQRLFYKNAFDSVNTIIPPSLE